MSDLALAEEGHGGAVHKLQAGGPEENP